jgi:HSP20 family protein
MDQANTAAARFTGFTDDSACRNALAEIDEIRRRFDLLAVRLTEQLPTATAASEGAGSEPEMDVYENDQEFLIHAAVPGATPQSIRVEATPHSVILTAETPAGLPNTVAGHGELKRHRRSRHSGHDHYHFVYTLHAPVAPQAVRALFRHGIVEIHLPKVHSAYTAVAVPIILHQDSAGPASPHGEPYGMPGTDVAVVAAHEGSPGRKLGAAYVPSANEDHATKARSIGELPAQAPLHAPPPEQALPAEHNRPPSEPAASPDKQKA